MSSAPAVSLNVTFSLDPLALNDLLAATPALSGYRQGTAIQFPTLVEAGGTSTVVIPVPRGYALGFLGSISGTSEVVDAQVTAVVYQDGLALIGAQGFTLGPGVQIGIPGYAATTGIEIVFTNPSQAAVVVWLFAVPFVVLATFYQNVVAKLQNASWTLVAQAFGLEVPTSS